VDNEIITLNEDTLFNGDLSDAGDSDPDTTVLTANTVPVIDVSNGTLVVNTNGTYTYTPDPNFNGTDMAVISICDSGVPLPAICVNDTIFFTVNPINDPPIVFNDTLLMIEDSTFTGTVISGGEYDPDLTVLTADTTPAFGPAHGTITINTNGTFTYTPDPNYFGYDTVVIAVCDSGLPLPAICIYDTLVIQIFQTNDPPTIINDTNITLEDNFVSGTIITALDIDPDSLALVVDTIPVFGPSNGTLIIDQSGNYTYTPNNNFNGIEIIVLNVCDAGVPFPACAYDTLVITVTAVNDTSIISNDTISALEDNPIISTILNSGDYDIDTTALSVDTIPLSGPFFGTIVMNSNGTYTYTPNSNFNGVDTLVFNICDAGTPLPIICVPDTLFITILPVNDAPVIANDTIITNEDNPYTGTVLTGGDYDPDSTVLIVDTIPISGPSNGTIVINSNGTYTYTPNWNFFGIDTVIIAVCDSGNPLPSICVYDTIIVTVNSVNDTPVAVIDIENVCSGSNLQVFALMNDIDVDNDSIFISSIIQPGNGTATTDGVSITYSPASNYHGVDSIVYTICDLGIPQACSTGVVIINVNGPVSSGISANDVFCNGDSTGSVTTSPTVGTAFTYLWSTGATTQNITNVPAGIYSVTITDSLGCSIMDSATVLEPAAMSVSNTNTNVLCFGDSTGAIQLTVGGGSPGYTYLWSTGDTTQNVSQLTANNYSVTITDNNGCSASISTVITQPSAALTVTSIITPSNCLSNVMGSIDVTTSGGTGGYSFAWDNGQLVEDIIDVAGNYTLTVTDSNLCTSVSVHTISDNSTLTISSNGAVSFCQGDSVRLSSSTPMGAFQWMADGVNIPGATDSIYFASSSASYSLAINNSCGSFNSDSIVVSVGTKPVLSVSGPAEICEGDNAPLNVTGAVSYAWSPSTGLSDAFISNPVASPVLTTTYTITGTIAGCSSDTTYTLLVNPAPVVTISSSPFNCETGSLLQATGGSTFLWSPNYQIDSINSATPLVTPNVTTTYTVTVTDSLSCTSTATLLVTANCDTLKIPNGITPDGDGVNDVFEILGLENFGKSSLQIFNRWGSSVFKSSHYQHDWDGTCKEKGVINGETLPVGTYYYILELDNGTIVKTGFIELRR
jgi:gliding motility-associated-like protein